MKFLEAALILSFLFFGFYEAFRFSRKLICRQEAWKREFINVTTQKLSHPSPVRKSLCKGRVTVSLRGNL